MKTLTVYPPKTSPVTLYVQSVPWMGDSVIAVPPVTTATNDWLVREGFRDWMLGTITEDIIFEAQMIDQALTESEVKP